MVDCFVFLQAFPTDPTACLWPMKVKIQALCHWVDLFTFNNGAQIVSSGGGGAIT